MELTVVTVNFQSYDFCKLLIESFQVYSRIVPPILVIDNSLFPKRLEGVRQLYQHQNIGHGAGLNLAFQYVETPFVFVLDSDCHLLCHTWEQLLLDSISEFDVLAGKGPVSKPIRPACMFLKTAIAKQYDWRSTPGYQGHRITPEGFDVGIQAYYQMQSAGVKIHLLSSQRNRYQTLNGEEWLIDSTPVVYHHWHGSHLEIRNQDFPEHNLLQDRDHLFAQIPWRTL